MGYHGWIMLHRKLLSSQMYKALNSKQRDIMITCLLMANHSENDWQWGAEIYKCAPGQFVTSLDSIKDLCSKDVSVQSVRTSLLKLEKWGFLTNKSTKTGRLITIINWDTYQNLADESNSDNNRQPTDSQQTANRQPTANNNVKNADNDNNEKKKPPKPPAGAGVAFDAFWDAYDHKIGKLSALRAFNKARKGGLPESDTLVAIVQAQWAHRVKMKASGVFCPEKANPATWLNQGRWDDELKTVVDVEPAAKPQTEEERKMEEFLEGCH